MVKKIFNILFNLIAYLALIINGLGIFNLVFSRYNFLHNNPTASKIEVTILGFYFIFAIGFNIQIIKRQAYAYYGYMIISICGIVSGIIKNHSLLLWVSIFSLTISFILTILAFFSKRVSSRIS